MADVGFKEVVSQTGTRPPYGFGADWAYRDDGDAGLLHIGARWYDPVIGRWLQKDPWLGSLYKPLTLNQYLYCEDEPIDLADPDGERGWLLGALVAFIIGALTPHVQEPYWPLSPEPMPGSGTAEMVGIIEEGAANANRPRPLPPGAGGSRSGGGGSGGGLGAIGTVVVGTDALVDGLDVVIKYRKRLDTYLDPEGDWY